MRYNGLVLTGTSGSGKSTIEKYFCKKNSCFAKVQAVTTRKKRDDDKYGDYEYISLEYYSHLLESKELLVVAECRGEKYGITYKNYEEVLSANKIPFMIITPKSLRDSKERFKEREINLFSLFIDASDEKLNERLKKRGETIIDEVICLQRSQDREYTSDAIYKILNKDIEKTLELLEALWEYRNTGGILSERLIKLMIECGMLLEQADVENVSMASYDLSIGDEYYYAGQIKELSKKDPFISIEPYDYIIASCKELSNMPKDVCGRFDVAVNLFCQGIILSNGTQVDPGFRGKLFCLLFNTSNKTVFLKRGQHYATLEFNKLIEPTTPYNGKYQNKEEIIHYIPTNALQGAINELKKEIEGLKNESKNMQNMYLGVISLILAVISLMLIIR